MTTLYPIYLRGSDTVLWTEHIALRGTTVETQDELAQLEAEQDQQDADHG